jgi:formate hydrogenlyase subunit 3/multisubunit Na+/H+ antiporter MnhD subunit
MIPASLLIIFITLAAAAPAYILRRWRLVEATVAAIACGLAIVFLARPLDSVLTLGGLTIDAHTTVNVLGRTLAIRSSDQMPLILLFIIAAILFLLGWLVSEDWTYVPVGLGILALLTAGLLIRPFVFAGLAFVAAAALGTIMAQAERSGQTSTSGALRYLVVNTLALPAFLGAGYVVSQANNISDVTAQAAAYGPAVILLCTGLILIFGAFPLYTWTHLVSKEAPPMAVAFLATVASGAACFLFLALLQDFTWFRDSTDMASLIKIVGVVILLLGGLLGWAQHSFGRVIACGISVEIGCMLILLSHGTALSVETLAFDLLARALSLGVLGLGVTLIQRVAGSDEFADITGFGRQHAWAAIAIAAGGLSLAGVPGTVGFVSRWAAARVIGQTDLELLVITWLAGASVGIGVVRGLAALFTRVSKPVALDSTLPALPVGRSTHQRRTAIAIAAAVGLIVVLGVAPGITEPVTRAIAQNYTFYK